MADPVVVPCAAGAWTPVAVNVQSARVYVGSTAPRQYRMTYRQTGQPAPAAVEGVILPMGDRDGAVASYRCEHGEAVDLYVMAETAAGSVIVHAPMGGSAAVILERIATAVEIMDDWDEGNRAKVSPIAGQAGVSAESGVVDDGTQRITIAEDDYHFGLLGAASDVDGAIHGQLRYLGEAMEAVRALIDLVTTVATTSQRVNEVDPMSGQYDGIPLVALEAVAADPGVSYAPDAAGQPWGGYSAWSVGAYLLGGVGAAAADRTVTATVEATNGQTVAGAVQWTDITESVKSLLTGVDSAPSFTATGATAVFQHLSLRNEDSNFTHFRIKYDWDADPSATNGMIVMVGRGRANS